MIVLLALLLIGYTFYYVGFTNLKTGADTITFWQALGTTQTYTISKVGTPGPIFKVQPETQAFLGTTYAYPTTPNSNVQTV